jgi:3',5'-cyclic-AMP phosphodiesterase
MRTRDASGTLIWVHIGDLHITTEEEPNHRDFLSIIETINTQLGGQIDFCVLPGDNADDGTTAQYALVRRGLADLTVPVHVIVGDHDRKPGTLNNFYQGLRTPTLPYSLNIGGYRCIFLDIVSAGTGAANFSLGPEHLNWLESELSDATANEEGMVLFMHAYPSETKSPRNALQRLLKQYPITFIDMGHTHYNELTNDGRTILSTTRSTGQVEEGPVGFSIVSLNNGIVSWRFKPLRTPWPLVMIIYPADHRLVTDTNRPGHIVSGDFQVVARVLGSSAIATCRCRIDEGAWLSMAYEPESDQWLANCKAPPRQFTLSVEATHTFGTSDADCIVVAVPGYVAPHRQADGSDADALKAWPSRHLLNSRLGPNRNGRQW